MNPIAMIFGLALLALSVFFVAGPFRSLDFQRHSAARSIQRRNRVKLSLERQRRAVLLALRDLDFDYQAGKITEEDYQTLRADLLSEVAQLMQGEERRKDEAIEALIQSRRKAGSAPQPVGKAVVSEVEKNFCKNCRAHLQDGANFCSKCGAPVEDIVCLKCHHIIYPGDRYCPTCGTAVPHDKPSTQTAALAEVE